MQHYNTIQQHKNRTLMAKKKSAVLEIMQTNFYQRIIFEWMRTIKAHIRKIHRSFQCPTISHSDSRISSPSLYETS